MPQLAAAETRTLLEQVNWETFLELAEGRAGGLGRHDGSRLAMLWLETPGAGGAGTGCGCAGSRLSISK